jgi:hypothetical protein
MARGDGLEFFQRGVVMLAGFLGFPFIVRHVAEADIDRRGEKRILGAAFNRMSLLAFDARRLGVFFLAQELVGLDDQLLHLAQGPSAGLRLRGGGELNG